MPKPKILIVDDDPELRAVVRLVLGEDDFELREAATGESALVAIQEQPPDLVLLDYVMPGMDGIEVTRWIREHDRLRDLPILILTGNDAVDLALRGIKAGADAYIVKPFAPDDLRQRVAGELRRVQRARKGAAVDLPTGDAVAKELERRVGSGAAFAAVYVHLAGYRSLVDHHGSEWGECVLHRTATMLRQAFIGDDGGAFIGHVAGEDFFVACDPDRAEGACQDFLSRFERSRHELHDSADLERGSIQGFDRRGMPCSSPLLAPRLCLVDTREHRVKRVQDVTRLATAALARAEAENRSGLVHA